MDEEQPDLLGMTELDCLHTFTDKMDVERNEAGATAHKELVAHMSQQYDHYIVEKDNGFSACAIFYRRGMFKLLKQDTVYFREKQRSYFFIYCHLALSDAENGRKREIVIV